MNTKSICIDFSKSLHNICLFIGPNGSGKTTILDAFMCVTIILERGTHSMRMGLITKRIGEKIISIIAEAKSRQIKFEAYSALYIILDTIAYEDFDAVSAFKEDCEQKGIVDVIEKDMYDNNKEMAELAEKIIENFFICEISTEGTWHYE